MKLHDLAPAKGSKKNRRRVGRGHASGQGKSAGRGTKGQASRSGGVKGPYFEGGQLPLVRRLPFKRGFTNIFRVPFASVNLYRLASFEANTEVTPETLAAAGIIQSPAQPVAILGHGELDRPLTIRAHRVSANARTRIEAAGGSIEILPLKADQGPKGGAE